MLHLLDNFLFDALLLHHCVLHTRASLEGAACLVEKLLKLRDLERTGLLEGHTATAATVIVEVTIVAKGLVVNTAVSLQ